MFELPDSSDYTLVADWVELQLTVEEDSLSRSAISSRIEHLTGNTNENFISDVWSELKRRSKAYNPPRIQMLDDLISSVESTGRCPIYVSCLLYSLYGVDREHRTDPKLFERLVAEAIRSYLNGEVYVFGWPVMQGQSPDIRVRIRELANNMCENFVEEPASRYKDRGVDVVGWKPFIELEDAGHRGSQIVILMQCATGANWDSKTTELPFDSWLDYIHWKSRPIKSFAVPKVIPKDRWHDISKEGGLLFDRVRILNLLSLGVTDVSLADSLRDWANEERDNARIA